jgi:hypothetical protein
MTLYDIKGKGKVVPVLSHEDVLGSGGIAPCILDLSIRWIKIFPELYMCIYNTKHLYITACVQTFLNNIFINRCLAVLASH